MFWINTGNHCTCGLVILGRHPMYIAESLLQQVLKCKLLTCTCQNNPSVHVKNSVSTCWRCDRIHNYSSTVQCRYTLSFTTWPLRQPKQALGDLSEMPNASDSGCIEVANHLILHCQFTQLQMQDMHCMYVPNMPSLSALSHLILQPAYPCDSVLT